MVTVDPGTSWAVAPLSLNLSYFIQVPAEWSSWFVAGHIRPSLQVEPRPMSVDFHDAEYRQRPYRMNMRHVKDL
ncbi:hypothetical protein TNCV_3347811 [Trichonephila clavipes]|nr:hypothetical protein TNCV_3347811 [Trichonephila clavipes]